MRIKLDENLPDSARPALADAGHDTDTAHAEGLDGADDPDVLAGAAADGRLLITLDRGLGDIRAYPPGTHSGVLVIRPGHQSPREIRRAVHRIGASVDLDELADASLSGATANFASAGPERADERPKYQAVLASSGVPVTTVMAPPGGPRAASDCWLGFNSGFHLRSVAPCAHRGWQRSTRPPT